MKYRFDNIILTVYELLYYIWHIHKFYTENFPVWILLFIRKMRKLAKVLEYVMCTVGRTDWRAVSCSNFFNFLSDVKNMSSTITPYYLLLCRPFSVALGSAPYTTVPVYCVSGSIFISCGYCRWYYVCSPPYSREVLSVVSFRLQTYITPKKHTLLHIIVFVSSWRH